MPFIIPDNFTIAGEVKISVDITEPTTNITLHIYDMQIHEDEVSLAMLDDNSAVNIVGHGYDEFRQFYIINFDQVLWIVSNILINSHLLIRSCLRPQFCCMCPGLGTSMMSWRGSTAAATLTRMERRSTLQPLSSRQLMPGELCHALMNLR